MSEINAIPNARANGDSANVVAIIPAHNEEARIGPVIQVVRTVKEIKRILVVDDGSEDNTSKVAMEAGAEVLRFEKNRGKAAAMDEGVRNSVEPVILFLDADLLNLEQKHVLALLTPVLNGEVEMTMGVFRNGRFRTDIAHRISPGLSGQRAIVRSVWGRLDQSRPMESVGYGIENELQRLVKENKTTLKVVEWEGVSQTTKEEKMGPQKGLKLRMKMYQDIIKTWTK